MKHEQAQAQATMGSATYEEVTLQVLQAYRSALLLFMHSRIQAETLNINSNTDTDTDSSTTPNNLLEPVEPVVSDEIDSKRPLSGPLLAQLVQACLSLAQHKSKVLSEAALLCLRAAVDCTSTHTQHTQVRDTVTTGQSKNKTDSADTAGENGENGKEKEEDRQAQTRTRTRTQWRSFFPGVFSGLHKVCTAGPLRGNRVRHAGESKSKSKFKGVFLYNIGILFHVECCF